MENLIYPGLGWHLLLFVLAAWVGSGFYSYRKTEARVRNRANFRWAVGQRVYAVAQREGAWDFNPQATIARRMMEHEGFMSNETLLACRRGLLNKPPKPEADAVHVWRYFMLLRVLQETMEHEPDREYINELLRQAEGTGPDGIIA